MATEEQVCEQLGAELYRVSVPNVANPGGQETNVYIVGRDPATLIDAGSDDGGERVLVALEHFGIRTVARIVLTHSHQDHAGAAPLLRELTGARIAIHPRDLADPAYQPVELGEFDALSPGDVIAAGPYRFEVIETPGHAPGHVSLYEPALAALFAGDLISGNGTVAVVPPRGSMSAYMDSLRRVNALQVDVIYPGHGPVIPGGNARIERYIARRERREQEIFDAVASGLADSAAITALLYPDVIPRFRRAAEGTVRAHLLQLAEQGRIRVTGEDTGESRFHVSR